MTIKFTKKPEKSVNLAENDSILRIFVKYDRHATD